MKQGLFTMNHLVNNLYTVHALKAVIAQGFNISTTDYCMLMELSRRNGTGNPNSLARQLAVTPSAITLRLNHLEALGLVRRQGACDDGRKVSVTLTEQAREQLPMIDRLVAQTISEIWQPLSLVQRELLLRGSLEIVGSRRSLRTQAGRVRADTVYAEAVIITYMSLSAIARLSGISLAEFSVLFALAKAGKPMRAIDIANMLLIRQNTMTAVAKSLSQKGYIELLAQSGDKRVRLQAITPEGNECFFAAYRPMSEACERRVGKLNAQERKEFKAIGDAFIAEERRRRALA